MGRNKSRAIDRPRLLLVKRIHLINNIRYRKQHIHKKIALTHGHFDHVAGVKMAIQNFSCPAYLHKLEEDNSMEGLEICKLKQWELCSDDRMFDYEDISSIHSLVIGNQSFEILQTPGHTSGSVCLYSPSNKLLLSGDTVFFHNYGRTDFDDVDYNSLLNSFSKLLSLPEVTYILPGHGKPTTIAEEITQNPLVKYLNVIEAKTTTDRKKIIFDKQISFNSFIWSYCELSTDNKYVLCTAKDSMTANRAKELIALRSNIHKYHSTVVDSLSLPLEVIGDKVLFSAFPTCLYFESGKLKGQEKVAKWFCSAKLLNRFLTETYSSQPIGKVLEVCKNLAFCVNVLHSQSVCLNSLSYSDFLVDIHTGTLRIVNSFDNCVLPNSELNYDWCSSPDFTAPENITGGIQSVIHPSIESDRHALAVCIYMLIFKRHPLRGSRINDLDLAKDEEMTLGTNALFIENPNDSSNRLLIKDIDSYSLPQCDCDKFPYTMFGDRIAQLFTKSFIVGLHNPEKRPAASEWVIALQKTIEEL